MNKKFISAVAAAVSAVLGGATLVACTNGLSYLKANEHPQGVRAWTMSDVDELKGYSVATDHVSNNSDMVVFRKNNGDNTNTLAVYDVKANRIALKSQSTKDFPTRISVNDKGIITVLTTGGAGETYTVYSRSGRKIYGDSAAAPRFEYDLVIDGNRYYRYDNDGETFDSFERKPTAGSLPSNIITFSTTSEKAYNKNYYYAVENTTASGIDMTSVAVYDNRFNFLSSWLSPVNAVSTSVNVLADGTLFIQYLTEMPADADDYDIYMNGDKVKLYKYTVDPDTGKAKKLKGDYAVGTLFWNGRERDGIISDDIDNIAAVMFIKDGILDATPYLYELKNNGKLGLCMSEYDGKSANIEPIGNGYYTLEYTFGEGTYLLNHKYEITGDISGITGKTQEYMWNENGVYTYTFNCMVDLTKPECEGYEFDRTVGDDVIFRKASDAESDAPYTYYQIVGKNGFEEIKNFVGTIGPWCYTRDENSGMYTYRLGTSIQSFTTNGLVESVTASDDYGLYMYDGDDGTLYVRASRAGK